MNKEETIAVQWGQNAWKKQRLYNILNSAKIRAKKKGLEFTITGGWFRDKVFNGVCEATGLPFDHTPPTAKNKSNPHGPSLDRMDSTKGYTPDNTKVVLWIHNRAKGDDDIYTLYNYCKALVKAIEG